MTKRELLENYRDIVIEIETLERQSDFMGRYIGGPAPIRSVQLTGMPRGTNMPEAAESQRIDTDSDVLEKIQRKKRELSGLLVEFELIVDAILDRRLRIIIRDYYALGWTDERIAEQLELSRQHVNRLRTAYLEELS